MLRPRPVWSAAANRRMRIIFDLPNLAAWV